MYQKVVLVGNLGRDPETRYTQSGTSVCNFSVATSERFKDKSGEYKDKTSWHKIVAWGKLAEVCQKYLAKGSKVLIEGKIEYREWEKDGAKRQSTEIVASEVKFLSQRKESSDAPESDGDAPQRGPEITDDDIPF